MLSKLILFNDQILPNWNSVSETMNVLQSKKSTTLIFREIKNVNTNTFTI